MLGCPCHAKGMTLLELMIMLAISIFFIESVLSLYSVTNASALQHSKIVHLEHEMKHAMSIMTNDLRRAGYWQRASEVIGTGLNTNPFMSSTTNIAINTSKNCILFSYDQNDDGFIPSETNSNNERYGYRLSQDTLQSRPTNGAFNCASDHADWRDLTNRDDILITALTFTPTNAVIHLDGGGSVTIRTVLIALSGRLKNDASIAHGLREAVRIRNDFYTA